MADKYCNFGLGFDAVSVYIAALMHIERKKLRPPEWHMLLVVVKAVFIF
jgi:hypothetical protein